MKNNKEDPKDKKEDPKNKKADLRKRLSEDVNLQKIQRIIAALNGEFWLKGGAFTNIVHGTLGDFDVVTDCILSELEAELGSLDQKEWMISDISVKWRNEYPILQFKCQGLPIEITCRKDINQPQQLTDKKAYLRKQDYFSNAFLYNFQTKGLHLLEGALEALYNKRVHIITESNETIHDRLTQDPWKIIRAIKLQEEKGFSMGSKLEQAIKECAHALDRLTVFEMALILRMAFNGEYAKQYINRYAALGLLSYFFKDNLEDIESVDIKKNIQELLKKEKEEKIILEEVKKEEAKKKEEEIAKKKQQEEIKQEQESEKIRQEEIRKKEEEIEKEKQQEKIKKKQAEEKIRQEEIRKKEEEIEKEKQQEKIKKKQKVEEIKQEVNRIKQKVKNIWTALDSKNKEKIVSKKNKKVEKEKPLKLFKDSVLIKQSELEEDLKNNKYKDIFNKCEKERLKFLEEFSITKDKELSHYLFMLYLFQGMALQEEGELSTALLSLNVANKYQHDDVEKTTLQKARWGTWVALINKDIKPQACSEFLEILSEMRDNAKTDIDLAMIYFFMGCFERKLKPGNKDIILLLFKKAIDIFEKSVWDKGQQEAQRLCRTMNLNLYSELVLAEFKTENFDNAFMYLTQGFGYFKRNSVMVSTHLQASYDTKFSYLYLRKHEKTHKMDDFLEAKKYWESATQMKNLLQGDELYEDDEQLYEGLTVAFELLQKKSKTLTPEEIEQVVKGTEEGAKWLINTIKTVLPSNCYEEVKPKTRFRKK